MTAKYAEFERVFNEANRAGFAAAEHMTPHMMVVTGGVPGETPKTYYESEGVCGFAWVKVVPGTSSFAKWLVKNKLARSSYGGGVSIWISSHNQSMERKEAHARTLAKLLTEKLGVKAYAESRMD